MVKLDVIMTRGGDGGETSLGDGARVRKDALRVEAYGTVDEANAAIGVLRLHTGEDAAADAMLARIQNDLFDIGADLCVPGEADARLRVADTQSARLEAELAEAVFFLCSDRASYLTGQVIAVDGGFDATGIGLPTLRAERRNL
ncbi:MAG: SDR family oxidoreductase [Roseomonas sp.]|nr:SDR family oxidoreductase [Roseomonas sp.]